MKPMKIVSLARDVKRPTTKEWINAVFDDFIELHGDRYYADDKALVGGIATLNGKPVTVIGMEKGHTLQENLKTNFGQVHPEGFASILWKDGSKASQAAELMKFTSNDLLAQKIVDRIIPEKKKTNEEIALDMREQLEVQLNEWSLKSKEEIVSQRLERFNQY